MGTPKQCFSFSSFRMFILNIVHDSGLEPGPEKKKKIFLCVYLVKDIGTIGKTCIRPVCEGVALCQHQFPGFDHCIGL